MKKLVTFLLCNAIAVCAMAQSYEMSNVLSLTKQIEKWCSNGGSGGRSNISRLCKRGMRIADDLTMRLAERNDAVPLPTYELNDYLNFLKNEMDKKTYGNGFSIAYSNIKKLPKDKLPNDTQGYDFYVCTVNTSGTFTYSCEDLFLVKNGKVHGIAQYKEDKDHKVHVDWEDLIDEGAAFGATYNYSKGFPIGVSMFMSVPEWPIMFSLDFGLATGNNEYNAGSTDNVEMTDILNYERTKTTKTLDPKYFVTLTPYVYFKYFAVGCGIGALSMKKKEVSVVDYYHYSHTSNSDGSWRGSGSGSTGTTIEETSESYKFMIRPTVKGFIPLDDDDEWALALSIGYDYVFGYKDMNGLNFGLGIKYTFE